MWMLTRPNSYARNISVASINMQQRHAHLAASRHSALRLPGLHVVRRRALQCNAISSPFKVKLLHPVKLSDAESRPLLVYLPGTDGTGQAILPQLPALLKAGYDVRTLYIPPEDRSSWDQLQAQVLYLLNLALAERPPATGQRLTLVAESFGGCLALRLAAAAPQLVEQMVLINPATCFKNSLGGLSSFVSSTNLLALFPQGAYTTAQGVLLPFLVDMGRVDPAGREALKRLILMAPPADFDPVEGTMEEDDVPTTAASRRRPASPPFTPAGSPLFAPAAAANFRANLLRTGDLPESVLRRIPTPVLVVSSAKDRMLPSITEGARLARLLPRGRRVILPDSGHACLLERGISLARIMKTAGMLPGQQPPQQQQQRDVSPQQQRSRSPVPAAAAGGNGNGRGPGGGLAAAAPAAAAALASSSSGGAAAASSSNGNGTRRITLKVPPRPPAAGLPVSPTPPASAPSSTAGAASSSTAAGAAGAAQGVTANNQPSQLVDAALEGVGGPSGLEFLVNVANKRAESSRLQEGSLGPHPSTSTSSDGGGVGDAADASGAPATTSNSSSSSGAGPLHPDPAALQAVVQGATVMAADDIVASAAGTRPSSVYSVDEGDNPASSSSSSDWAAAAASLSSSSTTGAGAGSPSTSSSSSSSGGENSTGPATRSPAAAAPSTSAAPGTSNTTSSSGGTSGGLAAGTLQLSTAAEASSAAAAVLKATSDSRATDSSQRIRNATSSGSSSSSEELPSTSGSSSSSTDDEAAAGSSSSSSKKRAGSSSSSSGSGDLAWDEWSQYLAPWRDLVSPVILGLHELPDPQGADAGRAMLFVGNHQKMGMYDMPLLLYELYMRGFKVKGLAHPGHWAGPLGPFFEQFGAVKAGPLTTHRLLRNGEQVLLFPGGAREVNKRAGEEYQLLWKDTPDFVRLAAKCDAIIVPFAAVGADDAYEVVMEVEEMLQAPLLGDFVRHSLASVSPDLNPTEAVLPITRLPGLGLPTPIPVPNLQRLYFKICTPLDTRALKQQRRLGRKDDEAWQELYQDVKGRVELGMQELLALRELDDERFVGARLGKAISSWLPAMNLAQEQPSEPTSSSTSGQ